MMNRQRSDVQFQASKIVQACNVQECTDQLLTIPTDAVIMIDVDDTLIKPASKFFTKASYKMLIDEIKRDKAIYPHYEMLLSTWRLQRKVVLVDQAWPSTLAVLKKHYRVYGLTKIDTGKFGAISSMEEWRYQELKGLEISFRDDALLENYRYITDHQFINKPVFYKGIFMTGSASKSQTLALYKQMLVTSYIVVIDDREEHLRDIEEYCKRVGLSFLGLHFVATNVGKEDGQNDVAEFQKKHFLEQGEWLEDEEAIAYMKRR